MPETTPPSPGKSFDLKKKVGPLPVWAWSLIGIGGTFLAWRWYQAKKAAGAQTSVSTSQPASGYGYNGLGSAIGGGYGGGFGGSGGSTGSTAAQNPTLSTPEGNQAAIPVSPVLAGPSPVPVPSVPSGIQPSYLQGLGLTPDQISGVLQPQNQPSVNPNVSPAPTQALPVGATLGPATGIGQRYLTPGPNPFPVTYG